MLLLHLCCAPCATYPLDVFQKEGLQVKGYFFNPNIHPFREFKNRLRAVELLAEKRQLAIDYHKEYGLKEYLRKVVFYEQKRCELCYGMRLVATAKHAKNIGAACFTTTLLYSRYQQHELIRRKAESVSEEYGIPFFYRDFREGWQKGIDMAIEMSLYRQSYCGCIYSEQERYDKQFRKKKVTPISS